MTSQPQFSNPSTQEQHQLSQQQTIPCPIVTTSPNPINSTDTATSAHPNSPGNSSTSSIKKRKYTRIFVVAMTLILALAIALFFIWRSPPMTNTPLGITQQNFSGASSSSTANTTNPTTNNGNIQVYVTGAVKHPGVYTLPPDARVFQLLQAAGGALPNANLVALNLAAKLTDGQEVYVLAIGEVPPTYQGGVPGPNASSTVTSGQLVNINMASANEMRQALHISSSTAQNIVNYRTQHGPFTSIDQLLQVVSRSIYDKIKGLVTI